LAAMTQFMGRVDIVDRRTWTIRYRPRAVASHSRGGETRPRLCRERQGHGSKGERDAYACDRCKARNDRSDRADAGRYGRLGFGGCKLPYGRRGAGRQQRNRAASTAGGWRRYRMSPKHAGGFCASGRRHEFTIANAMGNRPFRFFKADAFVRTPGPASNLRALASGWQDINTDSPITEPARSIGANFHAKAYSGRVEGGYRFVAPLDRSGQLHLTARGQFTTFRSAAYAEQTISGAKTRSRLWLRREKVWKASRSETGFCAANNLRADGSVLTARRPPRAGRKSSTTDPLHSATLPDAARARRRTGGGRVTTMPCFSGSAERNGGTLLVAAKFEGESSEVRGSYEGKGIVGICVVHICRDTSIRLGSDSVDL